jgi:RimJ/RimL family protein N-acetyltransferase
MNINVRPMTLPETDLIIDYFHSSTPEHLELMGVDPTRLPTPSAWRERYKEHFATPIEQRQNFQTIWLDNDQPIGMSSVDKIVFGDRANMHLHVIDLSRRNSGIGTQCVRLSVDIYFETLKLRRLFCEPNAFNVAPNRTLQKAGFRYLKTHMTVPNPLNYYQAVTRWVIER